MDNFIYVIEGLATPVDGGGFMQRSKQKIC